MCRYPRRSKAISGKVVRTPLLPSRFLSETAGVPFHLKMETMQPTGAFKLRGATNAAQNVDPGTNTLTCCSTGNHGRSVAYAARELGLKAVICMSSLVPKTKIDGVRALGAEVRIIGTSQDDALAECRRIGNEPGVADISPFDDPHVIAGQGTIGAEVLEDLPDLRTLLIPLSGGGAGGGSGACGKNDKSRYPGHRSHHGPRRGDACLDRGRTSRGSARSCEPGRFSRGGIGLENRLSFRMCRDLLDDIVLVSEEEIYRGMQALYYEDSHVAEGACAVGIAACLAGKLPDLEGPVATIITGRNVDMNQFTSIVSGQDILLGDYLLKGAAYAP
ncbi:pyridoxal-phosphate dependent enzyme [Roseibium salinum]|uniref:pyridoxal-phosphate dependent enzyme n=1 Tax=Roseibium salinum TaxID=1604349 RepID=UPI00360C155B